MANVKPLKISAGRVAVLPSTDVLIDSSTAALPYASFKSAASAPTVSDDDSAGYRVGSIWIDTSTGSFYTCSDDSTGAAVWDAKSSFGTDFQSATATARTTTTSSTFQDKATLVTAAVTGTYLIAWSAVMDVGTANADAEVQLYDSTGAAVVGVARRSRIPRILDTVNTGGLAEVTLTGSAITYKVQYRSVNNVATIGCQDVYLEFWRVGA